MVSRSSILLGPILTPRALRAFAASVFVCALAMPWLAWWMGAFGEAREVVASERVIEYRPAMVALPGGKFWMGSPDTEANRRVAEVRHEAEVGDFELCRTEVTQGQWKAVMDAEELKPDECGLEGCDDDKPITGVTWYAAVEYLNRLTEKENERRGPGEKWTLCYWKVSEERIEWDRGCTGYRLPTEAEWEYAARAGSETAYFFGDEAAKLCEYGNVADRTANAKYPDWTVAGCEDGAANFARVGSYRANPWGLYDVYGNAWEWVWDWYGDYDEKAPKNSGGPENGDFRVLRGGSFKVEPWNLRSAYRSRGTPTNRICTWSGRGLEPVLKPRQRVRRIGL
jgi:formylglycine-generating enzyme required for sulfatase activity